MLDREKYYTGILIFVTGAYGILLNAFHVAFDPSANTVPWLVGSVVIPILLLALGRTFLFGFFIRWINRVGNRSTLVGTWDIVIEFEEEVDGKLETKIRTGHLKIDRGIIGYQIEGKRLFDHQKHETMRGWKGTEVSLIRKGTTTLMVYTYETYESENKTLPSKIGLVIAGMLDGGDMFRGVFHDISVAEPGKTLRSGSVRLISGKNRSEIK